MRNRLIIIIINTTIILLTFLKQLQFIKNMVVNESERKRTEVEKFVQLYNKKKKIIKRDRRKGVRKVLLAEEAGDIAVCRNRLEESLWNHYKDER